MEITASIYHIFFVLLSIGAGVWAIVAYYIKNTTGLVKGQINKELSTLKEHVESNRLQDLLETRSTITTEIENVKETIRQEGSPEKIKSKVKDFFDGEMRLIEKDVREIKDNSIELKRIMSVQQETLIAIQMSLTELKPRLSSLENRVQKIEQQLDK